jgi:uncharacterized membrane protein YfcA
MIAELGLSEGTLAIVALAFFAGAFIKGALGFGMPLLTMAVIPLVAPVGVALALNAVLAFALNVAQTAEAGLARAALRRFWPVVAMLGPGVAVGAALVSVVDEATMRLLLGATVLGFVALSATGAALSIPPERERLAGLATGAIAGLVGGLTTANGPILLMYLVGLNLERPMFRAALGLLFLATALFAGIGFAAVGVLDGPRALLALICLAPAAAGTWAGMRLGRRLPQKAFRAAVMTGLGVIGANYILGAL